MFFQYPRQCTLTLCVIIALLVIGLIQSSVLAQNAVMLSDTNPEHCLPYAEGGSSVSQVKEACSWISVPRSDVPDFAAIVRQKKSEADQALPNPNSCPQ